MNIILLAEVAAPEVAVNDPWIALIPVITTALIAGLKKVIPRVPPHYLPWLAPLIGAAADIALYYSAGVGTGHVLAGAFLGSAGVGLREIYDQSKKRVVEKHEESEQDKENEKQDNENIKSL